MADPIEEKHVNLMNVVAHTLDELFNPGLEGDDRKVAFTLLVAGFGQIEGGRVNYISNGDRSDTIKMMKELIARFEGRYITPEESSTQ
jgi:hypothetical protein